MTTRIFGALFYATTSILIMLINKVALYVWGFPSVASLALAQFMCTVISLRLMKATGWITFPDPTWTSIRTVFPLPIVYVGNAVFGLSGTKALSLPMFTVLRRTNMIITMGLESWLLGTQYSFKLKMSIAVILMGSVIATVWDMQLDILGYSTTLLNNICTSVNGVTIKMKLKKDSVWELMYLNSLLGTPLLFVVLVIFYPETFMDVYHFEHWMNVQFVVLFVLCSVMGTVLQFSIIYCTKVNSALTTVVVGILKNVLTSYVGVLDVRLGYTFNWVNFIGVNISLLGGIWYVYLENVTSSTQPLVSCKI